MIRPSNLHSLFLKRKNSKGPLDFRWIQSSALTITPTLLTKPNPPKESLTFGTVFSPHMLTIEYSHGEWKAPKIVPYGPLSLSPASSCLHYGTTCFEGMKAYKQIGNGSTTTTTTSSSSTNTTTRNSWNHDTSHDDSHDHNHDHSHHHTHEDAQNILLFRPELNMKRLKSSMERLSMPGHDFDPEELIQCIMTLVDLDSDVIPSGEGYSLYIRPNVIATHPHLGVSSPSELLLYVITCPVGPYFKSGFKPVKLLCSTDYVRAFGGKGGTGGYKLGGNYAPTLKPAQEASALGYHQVLWLNRSGSTSTSTSRNHPDDNEEYITEVGAMNVFLVLEQENGTTSNGRLEIVTPPLDRGDILPGVTRQSIVELTSSWSDVDMVERNITISELKEAVKKNRLVEAFGAGTAAVVCPIECFHHHGIDWKPRHPAGGDVMHRVWNALISIQYGKISHEWSRKVQPNV